MMCWFVLVLPTWFVFATFGYIAFDDFSRDLLVDQCVGMVKTDRGRVKQEARGKELWYQVPVGLDNPRSWTPFLGTPFSAPTLTPPTYLPTYLPQPEPQTPTQTQPKLKAHQVKPTL
eukprot:scaffold23654_cov68-Cyclotella_meneghiniana.AAC.3